MEYLHFERENSLISIVILSSFSIAMLNNQRVSDLTIKNNIDSTKKNDELAIEHWFSLWFYELILRFGEWKGDLPSSQVTIYDVIKR